MAETDATVTESGGRRRPQRRCGSISAAGHSSTGPARPSPPTDSTRRELGLHELWCVTAPKDPGLPLPPQNLIMPVAEPCVTKRRRCNPVGANSNMARGQKP